MRRSRRDYRRDWRENNRRERMVLIASSAFVLVALTMSGLYLRNQSTKSRDDGYTIDFTALENSAASKSDEIADARGVTGSGNQTSVSHWSAAAGSEEDQESLAASSAVVENPVEEVQEEVEDELDYMPLETDSHTVEIAETGDETVEEAAETAAGAGTEALPEVMLPEGGVEAAGLIRPVNGEVLLPYSMESSIYFATLDQYKRNPAVLYQAAEDTTVTACAAGRVMDIYEDAELGRALKLDLGDGYEAVYGQMKEIYVVEDAYVAQGDVLGTVAAPTKYYSVEGGNLYFSLKKNGVPVNPEELYRE